MSRTCRHNSESVQARRRTGSATQVAALGSLDLFGFVVPAPAIADHGAALPAPGLRRVGDALLQLGGALADPALVGGRQADAVEPLQHALEGEADGPVPAPVGGADL